MSNRKFWLAAVAGAAALAVYAALPSDCPEAARRTAAVFILAALFWAFEIVPLFATSLLVVPLLIVLLAHPGSGTDPQVFLSQFSNPVIMLFLGGFVLARVMQKYRVDRAVVERLLPFFGRRPYFILLGFILATGFLSLWMSNTASAALMLAIVAPVLSRLDADDAFKKALVLSIAFASNIGGIGTPVGTPPNAIALGVLAEEGIRIGFLDWMFMAMPLALGMLLVASVVLYVMFPPKHKQLSISFGSVEGTVPGAGGAMAIGSLMVLLWLTSGWHHIPESVVSLACVALFAGLGFLKGEDLKSIHWDILILMWGGLALGKAMELSGLGRWVVALPLFSQEGFWLVVVFCLISVIVSIFVSNTATANLVVPLAMSVPGGNQLLLAVVVALSCSFDMILPISTPSNAMVFSTGVLSSRDMLKSGAVIIIIAIFFILLGSPFLVERFLAGGAGA